MQLIKCSATGKERTFMWKNANKIMTCYPLGSKNKIGRLYAMWAIARQRLCKDPLIYCIDIYTIMLLNNTSANVNTNKACTAFCRDCQLKMLKYIRWYIYMLDIKNLFSLSLNITGVTELETNRDMPVLIIFAFLSILQNVCLFIN